MGDLVKDLAQATDRLIADLEVAQVNLATLLESVALSTGEPLSTEPSAAAVDRATRVLAARARLQLWSMIDRNVMRSEARQAIVLARSEADALRMLHAQLGLPADDFYKWAAHVEVIGSAPVREGVLSLDEVEAGE